MNPYNPNQMGSFYQPNQQYPNPQQQYPQPQYPQAGPFYGQGQQQGQWGAPSQQGYYPNQQPQYYPNSQGQQAWGNQGQNTPFYPQPGVGSPYAGANPNWQGEPGAFPQHPFPPFNNVQQVFTPPPAGFQNFAAAPQANYFPQSTPSFAAPTYPYTPLQNYTAAPQYTPPASIAYQNPTPISAASESHIPKYTEFQPETVSPVVVSPVAVDLDKLDENALESYLYGGTPTYHQPQPETVSPVVVNPIAKKADDIDEDTLESYIDYLTNRIDNNSSCTALSNVIENLRDYIHRDCGNDDQKTNLYYNKIIERNYNENSQPSRALCSFMIDTGNNKQLSVNHFINYIKEEIKQAKNDKSPEEELEHIEMRICLFAQHVKDVKGIMQLAKLIQDNDTRDNMINHFIKNNPNILLEQSVDTLINLVKEENVRNGWIKERIKVDPQSIKTHIKSLMNLTSIDKALAEFLATVGLDNVGNDTDTFKKIVKILDKHKVSWRKLQQDYASKLRQADSAEQMKLSEELQTGWDGGRIDLKLMREKFQKIKSKGVKYNLARYILQSNRYDNLDFDSKLSVLEQLPLQSESLKSFHIQKTKLQKYNRKVNLDWNGLNTIANAVTQSEAGFSLTDGIDALTFVKDNLSCTQKELVYWGKNLNYDLLKTRHSIKRQQGINQESSNDKILAEAATAFKTSDIEEAKLASSNSNKENVQTFLKEYEQIIKNLKDKNTSTEHDFEKPKNNQRIEALENLGQTSSLTEDEKTEFTQLTGMVA